MGAEGRRTKDRVVRGVDNEDDENGDDDNDGDGAVVVRAAALLSRMGFGAYASRRSA